MREITEKERNTMNKRNKKSSIRLAAVAVCTAAVMVSGAQAAFADVPNSAYYKSAVDWAVSKGITSGTDANHFDPSGICTRAQTVTFMWRAAGSPKVSANNPFTDVKSTDYYYNAVLWAVQNNITSGISATQFAPNEPVSRAQMACFLYKQAGNPKLAGYFVFTDVSEKSYYYNAVHWARQKKITSGTSDDCFSPVESCTRAQIVTFLKRYEERPADAKVLSGTELDNLKATIIHAFENVETKIDVSSFRVDSKQFREILDSLYDSRADQNPYYIASISTGAETDGTPAWIQVHYQYSVAEVKERREKDTKFNSLVKEIVKDNVTSGMSDFDKAKALHDYLVLNCEYDIVNYLNDTIPAASYTATGALVNHIAVCAGYARAYQALLTKAGIPSYYVAGTTASNGAHAWNIVQIDGEWYHVDTTWDDPVPDEKGRLCYTYFLRSDKYMRSHEHKSWNSSIKCTSTKYDTYDPIAEAQEEQRRKEEEERRKQQEEQQRQDELKRQEELKQQEEAKKQEELKKQQEAENKQQEQEREQTIRNIQAEIRKQLDARAYPDAESLKNASDISYDDVDYYVYLPDDYEQHQLVLEAYTTFDMSAYEPAVTRNGTESPNQTEDKRWHLKYRRHDIWDELKRRENDQKAETDRQVESLIQELQQAIIDGTEHGNRAKFTYDCPGYSYEVIAAARKKMQTDNYAFSGYTSSDYSLSQRGTTVEIYSKRWEQNEIARWIPVFEEGVRNHETRITVPIPDEYFESGSTPNYIVWASWEVFREGYTVDGMTAGTDYTNTDSHFNYNPQSNKTESYCVTVSYADSQAVSVDE